MNMIENACDILRTKFVNNDGREEVRNLIVDIDSIFKYQLFTIDGLSHARRLTITHPVKSELRLQILSDLYEALILAGATPEMIINHIQMVFDAIVKDTNLYTIYKDIIPPHVHGERLLSVLEIYGPLFIQVFILKSVGLVLLRAIESDMLKESEEAQELELEHIRRKKLEEYTKGLNNVENTATRGQ